MSPSIFVSALYLLSFALLYETVLGVNPLFHTCPSSSEAFTANGAYETNLNVLLVYLYFKAPPSGFGSGSVGPNPGRANGLASAEENPDRVNGLALCRGDVNSEGCKACVAEAGSEIRKCCPFGKQATIWYDNCLLRYSNSDFLSNIDYQNKFAWGNVRKVTDPVSFIRNTREMLSWLTEEAYITPKRYAATELNLGESRRLYGLVQCTRDLSSVDCKKCLDGALNELPSCCDGKEGGRVFGGSCNIRYEIYPFFKL